MSLKTCDVAVIGAGIIGISSAYHLKKMTTKSEVVLIDSHAPMALTSAQSGENYRNWWPHPVMRRFTDRSITLMEELARETNNRINLTRRGYVLATRHAHIDRLLAELEFGYGDEGTDQIRFHTAQQAATYTPPTDETWGHAPDGVDILQGYKLISEQLPWYADDISSVIHIRRAGHVDSQQLGQVMLEMFRDSGGQRLIGTVRGIERQNGFKIDVETDDDGVQQLSAMHIVNAAGPFLNRIADMVGTSLPVTNVRQQKLAFEDTKGAIARQMPFSIDLDPQRIDWTDEEREYLFDDATHAWLANEMPGAIHCRPDGGDHGTWIKLGWAYNETPSEPSREPALDDQFPEIVVRGAARLHPGLKAYYGHLPRSRIHYGGYYTLTDENWPLIGPTDIDGFFIVGALSGFGTMAACAAGELCANWISGRPMTDDAVALSLKRYGNDALMSQLKDQASKGIL